MITSVDWYRHCYTELTLSVQIMINFTRKSEGWKPFGRKTVFPFPSLTDVSRNFWINFLSKETLQNQLPPKRKCWSVQSSWVKFQYKWRKSFSKFSGNAVKVYICVSCSSHQIDYVVGSPLRIRCQLVWTPISFINTRVTCAIMST